jgi:hypothetical protein
MKQKDLKITYTDTLLFILYSIAEFLECKIDKDSMESTKLLL